MKNLGVLVLLMVSVVGCSSVDSTAQRQNIQPQAPSTMKSSPKLTKEEQEIMVWVYCGYVSAVDNDEKRMLFYINKGVKIAKRVKLPPEVFDEFMEVAPMVYKDNLAAAINNGYGVEYFQKTMVDACEMKARVSQEV